MMPNTPNLMAIWYYDQHTSIDMQRQMKIHLYQTFTYSRTFNRIEDLLKYLATAIVQHIVFIITSEKETKHIHHLAQQRRQCRLVYELPFINQKSSISLGPARMHLHIKISFETIVLKLKNENLLPESANDSTLDEEITMKDTKLSFGIFKSIPAQHSFTDFDKESLNFLLCQSLIETVITMTYDASAFNRMCYLFRMYYKDNLSEIDTFEDNYQPTKAIYYYTRASFLFRVINRVLRLHDATRIYEFGYYMADLYKQLEELGNKQRCNSNQPIKTVYRGKNLSSDILQQLKDSIGHPISINELLSTTKDCNVARVFAGMEGIHSEYQSVIFEMHIDNTASLIRPYADVSELSDIPDENEVLFFMGFVWKIESMEELTHNRWHIVLESCKDYDPDLIIYMEYLNEKCPFLILGNMLEELGDSTNAKNFYQLITENENFPDEIRGQAHYSIATLATDRGDDMEELYHLRQAEMLIKQTPTPDSKTPYLSGPLFSHDIIPSRICILNNIGRVYQRRGNYENAQDRFEKALKEPGSDIDKAVVLNNYGLLKFQCRDYEKAHDYFNEAIRLAADAARITEFKENLELVRKMMYMNNTQAMDLISKSSVQQLPVPMK